MKRLLCIGKVVNGTVVVTAPTLEERLDAAIERNEELLQMNRDLDALVQRSQSDIQAREVNSFRCTDTQLDELLDAIENDHSWIRRGC